MHTHTHTHTHTNTLIDCVIIHQYNTSVARPMPRQVCVHAYSKSPHDQGDKLAESGIALCVCDNVRLCISFTKTRSATIAARAASGIVPMTRSAAARRKPRQPRSVCRPPTVVILMLIVVGRLSSSPSLLLYQSAAVSPYGTAHIFGFVSITAVCVDLSRTGPTRESIISMMILLYVRSSSASDARATTRQKPACESSTTETDNDIGIKCVVLYVGVTTTDTAAAGSIDE